MSHPNILLFADVHGRIPMMLKLAWRFQRERQVPLDLILVVGDLGVWPDLRRLDSATRKHSFDKPAELGFHAFGCLQTQAQLDAMHDSPASHFFQEPAQQAYQRKARGVVEACLDGDDPIQCPIVFIGGNHEDYDYLNQCREMAPPDATLIPVDQAGCLHWLPSGERFEHSGLQIGGIDGIEAEASGRAASRYHPAISLDDDKALSLLEALSAKPIDLLLTHDGPPDVARLDSGSPLFLLMLQELQPTYHCFGHYHSKAPSVHYRDLYDGFLRQNTLGTHINKFAFTKAGTLRPQSLLHLTDAPRFVDAAEDDWILGIRHSNWHH